MKLMIRVVYMMIRGYHDSGHHEDNDDNGGNNQDDQAEHADADTYEMRMIIKCSLRIVCRGHLEGMVMVSIAIVIT